MGEVRGNNISSAITLKRLVTEQDWQACKDEFNSLEKQSRVLPWATWQHLHSAWSIAFPDRPCWFIRLGEKDHPLAVGVWREEQMRRMKMDFTVLRSLDWNAATVPPLLVNEEFSKVAYDSLWQHFPRIHRETKADLLCLFQQSGSPMDSFLGAIRNAKCTYVQRELSASQVITLNQWAKKKKLKQRLQNLRRNERRIESEFGHSPEFTRFRGNVFSEISENGLWDQFLQLWKNSWQRAFQKEASQGQQDQGLSYTESNISDWSQRGWLDFCVLTLHGKLLSAYLNLAVDGKVWMLQTYYDSEFSPFGVGTINLVRSIQDSLERGDEEMDFGGEAVTWKRRWSTGETPIYQIDLALGGSKGTVWSILQRLRKKKDYSSQLHSIQSRADFEASKNEQSPISRNIKHKNEEVKCTSITTHDDWHSIRQRLEKLEQICEPNPWATWSHLFQLWSHFHPEKTCWLVEVPMPHGRGEGLMAAALWMEEDLRRSGLPIKTLRSLDMMSMRMNPFWVVEGLEDLALSKLAKAIPEIARKTGAQLACLYRQSPGLSTRWIDELKRNRIPVKTRVFTISHLADLNEGFDYYLAGRGKKLRYNLRKALKRSNDNFNLPPERLHFQGHIFKNPEMQELWPKFESLRRQSWQVSDSANAGMVDADVLEKYLRKCCKTWSQQGWLDFHVLKFGDSIAATTLNLKLPDRYYGWLTAYDPEFKNCSPGLIAIEESFRAAAEQPAKLIELGGEGAGWKTTWSTRTENLLAIEFPLGGWQSYLWRIVQAVKKQNRAEPLR